MMLLSKEAISTFSQSTRSELAAYMFGLPIPSVAGLPEGFTPDDFDDVVDLTPGQVEEFMKGCAEETRLGLRVFAENGPVVHAEMLGAAGIDNYSHFQSRVTKRTRTITGNKKAFLFTWDDWSDHPSGIGKYAVSAATLRSLRIYFNIEN